MGSTRRFGIGFRQSVSPERVLRYALGRCVSYVSLASITAIILANADPVFAQPSSGDRDRYNAIAPKVDQRLGDRLALPDPMPVVPAFDTLTPFQVEGARGREYAVDPKSIRLSDHFAMMTLSIRPSGGAMNSGYYAIDCQLRKYRMMALFSGGTWKPSTISTQWKDVSDLQERRNQFVALHAASCELGGFLVKSTDQLLRRLTQSSSGEQ
ncbi:MAG: CNP1-like family protein [Burkholderiaceae bacterium]